MPAVSVRPLDLVPAIAARRLFALIGGLEELAD